MRMLNAKGVYALLFHVPTETQVLVGRLGMLRLSPGFYVYVGSARGPGGLAARISRHLRREKTLHWHIDYLTTRVLPVSVLYTAEAQASECMWAQRLLALQGAFVPLVGFGNSDCRDGCPAHLVGLGYGANDSTESVVERLSSILQAYVGEVR